jgi:tetratricopeptide (TPR) repeat protein
VESDQQKIKGEISLSRARQLMADGALEESLSIIKDYWLANPDDGQAPELLAELLKDAGRQELAGKLEILARRFNSEGENGNAPSAQELFEAGFGLIDIRQHELAAMLLSRCVKLVKDEPVVNYELGFALMSLRRFQQATPYFELVASKAPDFDTYLNLAACYSLTRRIKDAQAILQKIETLKLDNEQLMELGHRKTVLRRLESVNDKALLTLRDWLYILYGSILLRQGSREQTIKEDPVSIGSMLALLKGVLHGLELDVEVIEFYGPQSRPLARAFAELLEIPFDSYKGPDRPERALLTMTWANDIIGPHKSFTQIQERRSLFCYGLTWDEPLPLVPEIVGCLGHDEPMPWRYRQPTPFHQDSASVFDEHEFDNEVEDAYKSILYNARDLESDPGMIQNVQEAVDYYSDKKSSLMLGNAASFPFRSEYTAELNGS